MQILTGCLSVAVIFSSVTTAFQCTEGNIAIATSNGLWSKHSKVNEIVDVHDVVVENGFFKVRCGNGAVSSQKSESYTNDIVDVKVLYGGDNKVIFLGETNKRENDRVNFILEEQKILEQFWDIFPSSTLAEKEKFYSEISENGLDESMFRAVGESNNRRRAAIPAEDMVDRKEEKPFNPVLAFRKYFFKMTNIGFLTLFSYGGGYFFYQSYVENKDVERLAEETHEKIRQYIKHHVPTNSSIYKRLDEEDRWREEHKSGMRKAWEKAKGIADQVKKWIKKSFSHGTEQKKQVVEIPKKEVQYATWTELGADAAFNGLQTVFEPEIKTWKTTVIVVNYTIDGIQYVRDKKIGGGSLIEGFKNDALWKIIEQVGVYTVGLKAVNVVKQLHGFMGAYVSCKTKQEELDLLIGTIMDIDSMAGEHSMQVKFWHLVQQKGIEALGTILQYIPGAGPLIDLANKAYKNYIEYKESQLQLYNQFQTLVLETAKTHAVAETRELLFGLTKHYVMRHKSSTSRAKRSARNTLPAQFEPLLLK